MTWALVGVGIAVVGGVVGAAGQQKAADAAGDIGAINAQRTLGQIAATKRQTEADVVLLRQQLTRVLGSQRAAWGASGLAGDSGSALDVLAASITAGLQDQQRRREAGETQVADLQFALRTGQAATSAAVSQYEAQASQLALQGAAGAASKLAPRIVPASTPTGVVGSREPVVIPYTP